MTYSSNWHGSAIRNYPQRRDRRWPRCRCWNFRDHKERSLRLERAALLPVDGDTPIGWLLSLTDLSAERAAEEQRGVLLRFLSHDLRAPHSAILALLDVHRHQAGADAPLFEQIERQVRRALDLTDGFVLLARAESETYQFRPTLFAMLVLDVLDQALPIAQQKRIELLNEVDEQCQERLILADQGLLTRALFNLLENAIKYSPADSTVQLTVSCDGQWLRCELTDQGKGIAPMNCLTCSASIGVSLRPRASTAWAWVCRWSKP